MKNVMNEFKDFIFKGNIIDMAIGVVVGTAFNAIVTSLVNDIIMPCVGVLIGGIDFSSHSIALGGDSVLAIGNFIQTVVNFLIIAISMFIVVKLFAQQKALFSKKQEVEVEEEHKETSEELLAQIRDLLKEKQ